MRSKPLHLGLLILSLLSVSNLTPHALAHDGAVLGALAATPAGDFELALKEADFVFKGQVIKKEHALSTPAPFDGHYRGVPHTFVTYRIERMIKGQTTSPEITLRFLGGDVPGVRRMRIAQMPMLVEGDQDIVFVRGNGKKACPIIRWGEGRIRLTSGSAFGEFSEQIGFDSQGKIRVGAPRPRLDVPRTDGVFSLVDSSYLSTKSSPSEPPHPADFRRVTAHEDLVQALVQAQSSLGPQSPAQPVINQDPKRPFAFAPPTPVAPQDPAISTTPSK